MKRLATAVVMMVGSCSGAFAADYLPRIPTGLVPGAPIYWNWSGVYIGGQAGYSTASVGLANSTSDLVSYVLRNSVLDYDVPRWLTLADQDTNGVNYGGFAGFNTQWEDVIVGLELNYTRNNLAASASGSVGPLLVSNVSGAPAGHSYSYSVSVDSSTAVAITDILTLRGRAGWTAGPFLPYAFVGAAFGRANVSRYANVSAELQDTDTSTNQMTPHTIVFAGNPQQETKNGDIVYGFSAGLGVDFALFENMFLRAEWEYMQFPSIKGINVSINNVHAGLGVKF